jgi:hypothetical protein
VDTREFLERVLPQSGGQYFVGSVLNGKYEQGAALANIDAVMAKIERAIKKRENVFYATGVYGDTRTIADSLFKKALYVDLDCGGSHQGFITKKDAVLALQKFCTDARFPFPNIVVDSGGGIHGYWTFDQPVPAGDWIKAAEALKALCAAHSFAVDAAITADAARILRVPGTVNYKLPQFPKPCKVVKADPNDFTFEQIREALGLEMAGPSSVLAGSVNEDDLGANLYGERKYFAANISSECGVLKHTIETGGKDQPGVLWYRLLHLLAYCEDGRDYVHLVSNKHDDYVPARVEKRFDYAVARKATGIGPTTCTSLAQFMPSKCAECQYNGKVKTPLVIGKAEESYLPPLYRMTNEGVWKVVAFNEQGQPQDWQLVFPYKISDVTLLTDGHNVSLRMTLTDGPVTQTIVFLVLLLASELKELQAMFMMNGLYPTDTQSKEFKSVIIPWVRKMVKVKNAVRASIGGLGWSKLDGQIGFATGDHVYMAEGEPQKVTNLDRQLCSDYSSQGDRQAWIEAAEGVLADDCGAAIAGVLSAFAAPLIQFTGVSGAMLSLYSKDSGTGKSSALRVGQAVWGHPTRGINALNDTMLSVVKKMGFLHNLPAYWDEMRMRDEVESTIKLIFQLGQGKERSRLTSGTKMQEMGTWSTLITVATNEPVLDHIDQVVTGTNAGRLRVFEVEMPKRDLRDTAISSKLRDLDEHHGAIGAEYAQLLAKNHDKLRVAVQAMQRKIMVDLRGTNDERFWVAIVASMVVAASIANRQGWTKINVPDFQAYLFRELLRQRKSIVQAYRPTKDRSFDLLIQYIDEHRDQVLVCDYLTSQGRRSPGIVHIQPPRGEIVATIAQKDKKLRLKRQHFNTWLYVNARESPTEIIRYLLSQGATEVRASVSAGLANTLDARVYCLDIDLSMTGLVTLLDGNDETQLEPT